MPKTTNTIKQRKAELYMRISPEHLFNKTSIFHTPVGTPQLDQFTVDYIKTSYTRYFKSWLELDAKQFLLNEKE